jgi:regulator of sirC expression with transglutaminase-like and TPR domain
MLRTSDDDQDLSQERAIRVYRKHAARAISEERWTVAEIFIDRILEVNPRHTEAWLMKGHIRQHCRDDAEEALQCFRKVITLCGYDGNHPHVRRARRSLGRLLSAWGA